MRTFLQMAQQVDRVLGNRGEVEHAKRWVNDAYMLTAHAPRLRFRQALRRAGVAIVEDDTSIAFPADFYSVIKLRLYDVGGRPLPLQQRNVAFIEMLDPTVKRRPQLFAVGGGGFEIWPKADGAYSGHVRYRKRFAKLVADDDEIELDPEWEQVVLYEAYALGFDDNNEDERSLHYRRMRRALVDQIGVPMDEDVDGLDEAVVPGVRTFHGDW